MKVLKRLLIVLFGGLLFISCSEQSPDELIVYSGRSQALVDNLVDEFKKETSVDIKVRYGNDAELLAVLNEEGDRSPADVIWANTTGALATANKQGLLADLPDSLLSKPDGYTSSNGKWIPVTVRFRVLAYNPNNISPEELPESVLDLPNMESLNGRIGWTPTYSSFYDFLTTLRIEKGEDTAKKWLLQMQQLNPKSYSSNTPLMQAVGAGEIDVALTNHYYPIQMKYGGAEGYFEDHEHYGVDGPDPNANFETYHFAKGDIGNLALVTGAAQLNTASNSKLAQQFLGFLLSKKAQAYAAQSVNEYPVVKEIELPEYLLNEEEAFELSPDYDYEKLQQLEGTLDLLREVGLI